MPGGPTPVGLFGVCVKRRVLLRQGEGSAGNLGRVGTGYNVGTELNVPNALNRKPNRRTLPILKLNDSPPATKAPKKETCQHSAVSVLTKELFVLLFLFFILFAFWLIEFVIFHVVAGGLIHLLLIAAIITLIVRFTRRTA